MTADELIPALCISSGYWYLGTPYTDYPLGLEKAFQYAALVAGILMRYDVEVISPIAHCHPIAVQTGIDPRNGRYWMRRTRSMRRHARGLIVVEMSGWTSSRGLTAEREEFSREGKPIYHLNRVALRRLVADLKE